MADLQLALEPDRRRLLADELRALTDVLVAHPHVWVMTDDMYEHIAYPPFVFATPAEVEPRLIDRTLTVNGVSKAYAMTGWRIGYAAGPAAADPGDDHGAEPVDHQPLLDQPVGRGRGADRAAGLHRRGRRRLPPPPRPGGRAAERQPRHRLPRARGRLLRLSLDRRADRPPHAGRQPIATDEDFAAALLAAEGVAVVFGAAFGLGPNFRISYAASDATLAEACDRIARFADALD